MLANSMLKGLSVKLIYNIVFLKNIRLRPLVKITINVSNKPLRITLKKKKIVCQQSHMSRVGFKTVH